VLLVFPSGLEFIAAFFGCLYAASIPVPVSPTRPNRSSERFNAIARDSGASAILTLEALRARLQSSVSPAEEAARFRWLTVDGVTDPSRADDWVAPRIEAESVAFLQYTSGSTASPKGTIVSHANVLHNSRLIHEAFGSNEASVGVGWLPMTHDMGLIGDVMQPLYVGFPVVFMAPEHFLVKPIRWLRAISRYRATISGGPNFAYDFCSQRVKPEVREDLDLSSWELAFNGAEPVRPETIRRFSAEFSVCGFRREAFYPCYGLAESTLMVAGAKLTPGAEKRFKTTALTSNRAVVADRLEDGRPFVGSGRAGIDQQIVIVDPETCERLSDGQIGEIWIRGPSVALGYWRRPEDTESVFRAYLRDDGAGPYLRSGDLGFLVDGELFITGRLKDLIIIAGANHFPADIEMTVEKCHSAIRANGVAAFSVDVSGAERLVVVAEIDHHHSRIQSALDGQSGDGRSTSDLQCVEDSIREAVARKHDLSVHMICLIRQATIPRTSSGKIQHHLCRQQYVSGGLDIIGSRAPSRTASRAPVG
jgi:acyl-CoA synthetase (AMP-forming)/AMP-acid ligase II